MDIMLLLHSLLLSVGSLITLAIFLAGIMFIVTRFIDDEFPAMFITMVIIAIIGLTIVFYLEKL
jgi:uncharacterized membrane protein YhaH (DUF805 family)